MKNRILTLIAVIVFHGAGTAAGATPHGVAGFVLNTDISEYTNRVDMQTSMPVRYREFLKEVQISQVPAFKSGIITYGTCAAPNRIVQIRLKYLDASKAFFEQLLDKFKDRFGRDPEWRGDPFNVIIAWKWSFVDKEKNHISLILQHNVLKEDQKLGNVVKLSMRNLIEAERACFEKKHPSDGVRSGKGKNNDRGPAFWQQSIPQ